MAGSGRYFQGGSQNDCPTDPAQCVHIEHLHKRLDLNEQDRKRDHAEVKESLADGKLKFEKLLQALGNAQGVGLTVKWMISIGVLIASFWAAYSAWQLIPKG